MKRVPWFEHCLWLRTPLVKFVTVGRSVEIANQLSASVGALGELVELKQEKMLLDTDKCKVVSEIPSVEWDLRMMTYENRKVPAWKKASDALTICGIPKSRK